MVKKTLCEYCAEQGEEALLRQWHPSRNGPLRAEMLSCGSHRKVWWQCEKGHEWQAAVFARVGGKNGCPYCAGKTAVPGETDLQTLFPQVAEEWHFEKNGELLPECVLPKSNKRVWWRCERGHAYQAAVSERTAKGCGCPYCAGHRALAGFNDLATLEPKVAKQWHPSLNGALTPEQVTTGSHRKVWWKCPEGHVWKAAVYTRARMKKSGCPVCAGRGREDRAECYAAAMAETKVEHGAGRI